ncbi:adenyl-nucleotide exchange factor sse1 [Apophysomyces ossiformis]|uniref:Adenyl-nucleotide exchange factor sse1 n=1 Tax=Apophysomyces ossiformis TaxID=679940 RepID=A0A8H7EQG0_9FUNG|nr:adenyl-nucleotide exchange factor sse1 [Apophysomyces ossiformis]
MSVVGFDLGNYQSIVAVAKNGSANIICNEFSDRATPSLVSFGAEERYFGASAKSREIDASQDTVNCMKRLIGRTFNDPEVREYEKRFFTARFADVNGRVGVKVNYSNQKVSFSAVQIFAMLLNKLKAVAAAQLDSPVADCVIAIPGWFTDCQRRAVLDAAKITKLNCLRLINDTTAAALDYGVSQDSLPKSKPRNVAFVDIGQSSYNVAIVSLAKGKLDVRGTAYDIHFGGRDFDEVIVARAAAEIKEKLNIDIFSNKAALTKLRNSARLCKEELTSKLQSSVKVPSIINGKDFSMTVHICDFEQWAAPLLNRTNDTLQKAMNNAGLSIKEVESVRVIGGSTQIPALKAAISKFFGKRVVTTHDQEESVARGAAIQGAMLHPGSGFRQFEVLDVSSYVIKATWNDRPEDKNGVVIFGTKRRFPSSKVVPLRRNEPFEIDVVYDRPEDLPNGIKPWIGHYTLKEVKPTKGEIIQTRAIFRLNVHGIMSGVYAQTVEQKAKEGETASTDENKKTAKNKNDTKIVDRPVTVRNTSIAKELIAKYTERETEMFNRDALIAARNTAKKWLQECGYATRNQIEGPLSHHIGPTLKSQYMSNINTLIQWTDSKNIKIQASSYVEKLETLKSLATLFATSVGQANEVANANHTSCKTVEHSSVAVSKNISDDQSSTEDMQDIMDYCNDSIETLSRSPAPIHKLTSTDPAPPRTDAKTLKDGCSLVYTSPGTPTRESHKTVKTRAWRTGRSPGSVFFDITMFESQTKDVLKAIKTQYPNLIGGRTIKHGPQILAEINFDLSDITSRTQSCTAGFVYKETRILAVEALQCEPDIFRIRLTDLPFLKPDKLKQGIQQSLAPYGRVLDVGISRDADFGLYMGNGYAVLDRRPEENGPPFAEIKHSIQWCDSTDCFYAFWRDMPVHCVFCHELGHIREDCPRRTVNKTICFICGEKGHNQTDCLSFSTGTKNSNSDSSSDSKDTVETLIDLDTPTAISVPVQVLKPNYDEYVASQTPFTGDLIELDDDVIMIDNNDSLL